MEVRLENGPVPPAIEAGTTFPLTCIAHGAMAVLKQSTISTVDGQGAVRGMNCAQSSVVANSLGLEG